MDVTDPEHGGAAGSEDHLGECVRLLADVNALALKVAWLETLLAWELEHALRPSGLRSCILRARRCTKTQASKTDPAPLAA